MHTDTLAIDFGTSNSAAAIPVPGGLRRIPIEGAEETLPTAVFFPPGGDMLIGSAATRALIAGEDGRYMRALKSVLGQPLLHEKRLIGGQRRTLADIVADFLRMVRTRAEAATGQRFPRALSGRPVRFHSADPEKDAQAERDLRACYHAAGFEAVDFLAEPEAAARASLRLGRAEGLGLIVDIGGGTSDFTVFRNAGERAQIIASHGIRLGGTDFDRDVSLAHAMPLLGLGTQLRREMGTGLLPVPRAPYVDLATWARIPFLYTADTRRSVAQMAKLATDAPAMARLAAVLDDELGHDLAFAVEAGKIAANAGNPDARIAMDVIEPALAAPLTPASLAQALATARTELRDAAAETLRLAGVAPQDIARVIMVGGSSLMAIVTDELRALCPGAEVLRAEAFTAVVDGLALAAGDRGANA